jgi:hypothetical protein
MKQANQQTSTVRQRLSKQVTAATAKQQFKYWWVITVETVFSVGCDPRLYNKDPRPAEKRTEEVF